MNSYKHYSYTLAITVFTFFIWSSFCFAYGDDKKARDSLGGINKIGIIIDWDGSGMEKEELNSFKDRIKRDVNQTLQQKGIKVHSGGTIDTPPFFCLEMHSTKCGTDTHALYIIAKVMQEVVLKKKQSIDSISPTWSSGGVVGIVVEESIQSIVSMLVNEFVSAYLSVNPKNEAEQNI